MQMQVFIVWSAVDTFDIKGSNTEHLHCYLAYLISSSDLRSSV